MAGFDDLGVFFSENLLTEEESNITSNVNTNAIRRRFKEFLRQYHCGDFQYKYRNQLKDHYILQQYWIEVSVNELQHFDDDLADKLNKSPVEYLKLFELAATQVADEVTRPRSDHNEVNHIQVSFKLLLLIINEIINKFYNNFKGYAHK
jgi:DNA replication licensing factor MCM5